MMKNFQQHMISLGLILLIILPGEVFAESEVDLSCTVILCMSTAQRPQECASAISHYLSIKAKKWWKTLQLRRNFLQLCPVDDSDRPVINNRIEQIINGAEHCDPERLNAENRKNVLVCDKTKTVNRCHYVSVIKSELPQVCQDFIYGDLTSKDMVVKYVGDMMHGGHWVYANNE